MYHVIDFLLLHFILLFYYFFGKMSTFYNKEHNNNTNKLSIVPNDTTVQTPMYNQYQQYQQNQQLQPLQQLLQPLDCNKNFLRELVVLRTTSERKRAKDTIRACIQEFVKENPSLTPFTQYVYKSIFAFDDMDYYHFWLFIYLTSMPKMYQLAWQQTTNKELLRHIADYIELRKKCLLEGYQIDGQECKDSSKLAFPNIFKFTYEIREYIAIVSN
jgi:hypothetical protein